MQDWGEPLRREAYNSTTYNVLFLAMANHELATAGFGRTRIEL